MEDATKSLLRDASLLFVGAFISLATSLLIDFMHEKRDSKKEQLTKKRELNYDISKALGNRFYLTYDLLKLKWNKDTTRINNQISEYMESRQFWNQSIYSYQALLENYYGREIRDEFIVKVFNPLAKMGPLVEDKTLSTDDTTLIPKVLLIRDDMIKFIQKIYDLGENN